MSDDVPRIPFPDDDPPETPLDGPMGPPIDAPEEA